MTFTRALRHAAVVLLLFGGAAGCRLKDESAGGPPGSIPPPPDVAAPPADALKTPSGLASKVLRIGLGSIRPGPRSSVTVHFTGWTTDGQMFDSSVARGEAARFTVNEVIPGWIEGLQLMVVGEKRRFWIPGSLAYDNSAKPDAIRGMLVFDVELLDVR